MTEKDLFEVVKESLRKEGHLGKFQAEMRVKVMEVLNLKFNDGEDLPKMPENILLLNELIREYFEWTGYLYSSSIFSAECGLPPEKTSREKLNTALGTIDDEKSIALPLLLNIVTTYKERLKLHAAKSQHKHNPH